MADKKTTHRTTDASTTPESRFLEDVADQIAYKPLRPAIIRELEGHIEDRMEEYTSDGMSRDEAEMKAVAAMGDAISIGTELNAIHHTRTSIPLIALTAVLMVCGFLAASFFAWSPEQWSNGYLYYLPGIILLVFVTFKGYPWLVRYQKTLFLLGTVLYIMALIWALLREIYPNAIGTLFGYGIRLPFHMIQYYSVMLSAPVLVIAAYRMRRKPVAAIVIPFLAATYAVWFYGITQSNFIASVTLIFLAAIASTLFYMLLRHVFDASRRKLLPIAAAGCLLLFGVFSASPYQASHVQAFVAPETVTFDAWNDSYNALIIKELLSRTPATDGISLTPEELISYRTGEWYYKSPDKEALRAKSQYYKGEQDAEWNTRWSERSHYRMKDLDASNITLWDILPQHYHNNYLITVAILLYGWLPGLCLLSLPVLFYIVLFACIHRIRGKLAASTAFCCGVILLMQFLLYLLCNLGYQYETVTNLPLISEGKLSILVNMLLLGFIYSAYRYDRVIEDGATEPQHSNECAKAAKSS